MIRVTSLIVSLLVWVTGHAAEALPPLRWISGAALTIEGKAWRETRGPFDRLPARASGVVRGPVFSLGRDTAGLALHFTCNSPTLAVRWKLRRVQIAMPHFAATGVSGVDLYVRSEGQWRWAAVGRPDKTENETVLFRNQAIHQREFLLYLPLYNGIENIEIGVAPDSEITGATPDGRAPIVFYGTSVVQGGCASRPGMAYPAIVGRRLGWPTINLGFSGNGKAEPEMAALLAELDPACYVIDTLGNLLPEEAPRVETFVLALRKQHPRTPIVLVENLEYPDGILVAERRAQYTASNRVMQDIFDRLSRSDPNLHRVRANDLIGSDNEATVDGSHPTDLGFTRFADVMAPFLRALLEASGSSARP